VGELQGRVQKAGLHLVVGLQGLQMDDQGVLENAIAPAEQNEAEKVKMQGRRSKDKAKQHTFVLVRCMHESEFECFVLRDHSAKKKMKTKTKTARRRETKREKSCKVNSAKQRRGESAQQAGLSFEGWTASL
jgi:hypothetical protein